MVDQNVINIVKEYLRLLAAEGIDIKKAILFGSYAKGTAKKESDIDLMLVSSLFDKNNDDCIGRLWRLTKISNYKIEPIAVGEKRFIEDDISPIVEIARREGIEITV